MSAGTRQIKVTILGDAKGAEKALSDTAAGAAKVDVAIGGIGDGFKKASAGVNAFGAAMAGAGIGLVIKALDGATKIFGALKGSVIDTNAALETSKQGWTIMLGGAEAAEKQIQSLYTFAAETPFEFGEVDKASRLLATFGGAALNTKENLALVGDIAAATDQPFSDVAMWVGRMYSAMQNGQPFGEAAARLQEMGALSGEARTELEQLQKEGADGQVLWAKFNGVMGRFSGTMKAQAGTWSGLMSTVQDTINQPVATAGKPIFEFATKGLQKFAAALSSPAVTQFAQQLAQRLTVALTAVWQLIERAWPPLQRFVQGIISGGRAVIDAAQAFLAGRTNLGQFIGGIEILVGSTLANLGQLKDKVWPILQGFGGRIMDFLGSMLPQIAGQLKVWGQRFGAWVTEVAVPALAEALPAFLAAYGDWAEHTGRPFVIATMKKFGLALGDWVLDDAIPWLRENLPKWWAAFDNYMDTVARPFVISAMKDFAKDFSAWVEQDAIPWLRTNLPKWLAALDIWIATTALPAIQTLMKDVARAFGRWIADDAVPYLETQLPIWLAALGTWITGTAAPWLLGQAKDLGAAMVDGIIAGLNEAWHRILEELSRLASGLPGPVKDALDIHSPSLVFAREVGVPIVEGIARGIHDGQARLDRIIGDVVKVPAVTASGSAAVGRSGGGLALAGAGGTSVGQAMVVNFNFPNLKDLGDRRQVQESFALMERAWDDIVRGGRTKRDAGV